MHNQMSLTYGTRATNEPTKDNLFWSTQRSTQEYVHSIHSMDGSCLTATNLRLLRSLKQRSSGRTL